MTRGDCSWKGIWGLEAYSLSLCKEGETAGNVPVVVVEIMGM